MGRVAAFPVAGPADVTGYGGSAYAPATYPGSRRDDQMADVLRSSEQAALPPVVEGLLTDVVADGFAVYCCGDRAAPRALVASYEWDHCIDVVTIRNFDTIIAARVPKGDGVDLFAPEVVVWAYEGPPLQVLRALLHHLVHPAHPDAPTTEYPAPVSLHIPRAEQRPMTIRLPSSDQAGIRAARLGRTVIV